MYSTETTGLPKERNAKPENSHLFPYVCQLSWLIYDDETGQIVKIADKIIRLPDGVTPVEASKIQYYNRDDA